MHKLGKQSSLINYPFSKISLTKKVTVQTTTLCFLNGLHSKIWN